MKKPLLIMQLWLLCLVSSASSKFLQDIIISHSDLLEVMGDTLIVSTNVIFDNSDESFDNRIGVNVDTLIVKGFSKIIFKQGASLKFDHLTVGVYGDSQNRMVLKNSDHISYPYWGGFELNYSSLELVNCDLYNAIYGFNDESDSHFPSILVKGSQSNGHNKVNVVNSNFILENSYNNSLFDTKAKTVIEYFDTQGENDSLHFNNVNIDPEYSTGIFVNKNAPINSIIMEAIIAHPSTFINLRSFVKTIAIDHSTMLAKKVMLYDLTGVSYQDKSSLSSISNTYEYNGGLDDGLNKGFEFSLVNFASFTFVSDSLSDFSDIDLLSFKSCNIDQFSWRDIAFYHSRCGILFSNSDSISSINIVNSKFQDIERTNRSIIKISNVQYIDELNVTNSLFSSISTKSTGGIVTVDKSSINKIAFLNNTYTNLSVFDQKESVFGGVLALTGNTTVVNNILFENDTCIIEEGGYGNNEKNKFANGGILYADPDVQLDSISFINNDYRNISCINNGGIACLDGNQSNVNLQLCANNYNNISVGGNGASYYLDIAQLSLDIDKEEEIVVNAEGSGGYLYVSSDTLQKFKFIPYQGREPKLINSTVGANGGFFYVNCNQINELNISSPQTEVLFGAFKAGGNGGFCYFDFDLYNSDNLNLTNYTFQDTVMVGHNGGVFYLKFNNAAPKTINIEGCKIEQSLTVAKGGLLFIRSANNDLVTDLNIAGNSINNMEAVQGGLLFYDSISCKNISIKNNTIDCASISGANGSMIDIRNKVSSNLKANANSFRAINFNNPIFNLHQVNNTDKITLTNNKYEYLKIKGKGAILKIDSTTNVGDEIDIEFETLHNMGEAENPNDTLSLYAIESSFDKVTFLSNSIDSVVGGVLTILSDSVTEVLIGDNHLNGLINSDELSCYNLQVEKLGAVNFLHDSITGQIVADNNCYANLQVNDLLDSVSINQLHFNQSSNFSQLGRDVGILHIAPLRNKPSFANKISISNIDTLGDLICDDLVKIEVDSVSRLLFVNNNIKYTNKGRGRCLSIASNVDSLLIKNNLFGALKFYQRGTILSIKNNFSVGELLFDSNLVLTNGSKTNALKSLIELNLTNSKVTFSNNVWETNILENELINFTGDSLSLFNFVNDTILNNGFNLQDSTLVKLYNIGNVEFCGVCMNNEGILDDYVKTLEVINCDSLNMRNCTIENFRANEYGIALIRDFKKCQLKGIKVSNNTSKDLSNGTGAFLLMNENAGSLSLDSCNFYNNIGAIYGGALTIYNLDSISISNSFFIIDIATGVNAKGGGIYVYGSPLSLDNVHFVGCSSSTGAVYIKPKEGGQKVEIVDCFFLNNSGEKVSSIYGYQLSKVKLIRNVFKNNYLTEKYNSPTTNLYLKFSEADCVNYLSVYNNVFYNNLKSTNSIIELQDLYLDGLTVDDSIEINNNLFYSENDYDSKYVLNSGTTSLFSPDSIEFYNNLYNKKLAKSFEWTPNDSFNIKINSFEPTTLNEIILDKGNPVEKFNDLNDTRNDLGVNGGPYAFDNTFSYLSLKKDVDFNVLVNSLNGVKDANGYYKIRKGDTIKVNVELAYNYDVNYSWKFDLQVLDLLDYSQSFSAFKIASDTSDFVISYHSGIYPYDKNAYFKAYPLSDARLITCNISIYPNPCDKYLCFDINETTPFTQLLVFDKIGRFIKSYKIDGNGVHQFDISNLSPGFYLLMFKGKDVVQNYKLLKN